MDTALFPFKDLRATGVADPAGDIAFDEEPCGTDAGAGKGEGQAISIVQFDDL